MPRVALAIATRQLCRCDTSRFLLLKGEEKSTWKISCLSYFLTVVNLENDYKLHKRVWKMTILFVHSFVAM